ncbi:LysR family transcriptional regulator, partial [uncultured Nocardioides sp.]|uniref:LysR family transcriptional regulator n=1 Tax=uncultured Nocardioides sp. TaxID=198441 RepID=UPI002611535E
MLIPQIGNADLKLLRIFKTVAECGGISAAESELNTGRSTISKHLSDLETRLGFRLCNRGPAGFFLTDEGAQVLTATDALLESVRDFRTRMNEVRQKLVGTLRIAAFDQRRQRAHETRLIARNRLAEPEAATIGESMSLSLSLMAPTCGTDTSRFDPLTDALTPLSGVGAETQAMYAAVPDGDITVPAVPPEYLSEDKARQLVDYATSEPTGTIIVDPYARRPYHVQEGGK